MDKSKTKRSVPDILEEQLRVSKYAVFPMLIVIAVLLMASLF